MGRHSAPEPHLPRHRAPEPEPAAEPDDLRHARVLAARDAGPDVLETRACTAAVARSVTVVEPAVVEPAVVEPAVVEPTAVEPTAVEPVVAQEPVAAGTPTASARRRRWVSLASWVVVVAVAVGIAVVVRTFVLASFWIPSSSMEPTLHGCDGCNDDYVVVTRLSYRLHEVHRGDVIVFAKPPGVPDPDKYLIKRVVGLPGETISGHDGAVWIGNRPLRESYVNPDCGSQAEFAATTVPDGQVFVMGDNRCGSFDSRAFGTVPESTVVGRAVLIVWPLKRVHWL